MKNKIMGASLAHTFQKFSSVLILLIMIIFMSLANENFFSGSNFVNIIKQSSVLGIMAVGETLVILTAGIDLSVGSTMALSGCVIAIASTQWGVAPLPAVLLGIVTGTIAGTLNGVIITKLRIQAFIATLGMMTVAQGAALLLTDGLPISGIEDSILVAGSGMFIGLPISVFVFLIVAVMGIVLLNRTTLGRNVVAVGGNPEASKTSGIKVDGTQIIVYCLCGLCCALAGYVMVGRLNSANGLMGDGQELLSITAVALGGTSLAGGVGGIGGTIIGVVTIGVLNNGLDLMNTTPFWQKIILGTLIVTVVALDSWRNRKFKD